MKAVDSALIRQWFNGINCIASDKVTIYGGWFGLSSVKKCCFLFD